MFNSSLPSLSQQTKASLRLQLARFGLGRNFVGGSLLASRLELQLRASKQACEPI